MSLICINSFTLSNLVVSCIRAKGKKYLSIRRITHALVASLIRLALFCFCFIPIHIMRCYRGFNPPPWPFMSVSLYFFVNKFICMGISVNETFTVLDGTSLIFFYR